MLIMNIAAWIFSVSHMGAVRMRDFPSSSILFTGFDRNIRFNSYNVLDTEFGVLIIIIKDIFNTTAAKLQLLALLQQPPSITSISVFRLKQF